MKLLLSALAVLALTVPAMANGDCDDCYPPLPPAPLPLHHRHVYHPNGHTTIIINNYNAPQHDVGVADVDVGYGAVGGPVATPYGPYGGIGPGGFGYGWRGWGRGVGWGWGRRGFGW